MGSRIRTNSDINRIFECYLEIGLPSSASDSPFILQKYPDNYSSQEILKSVPQFAYPCAYTVENVTHFSFVLTNIDSKWTFGFCRHAPNSQTCLVMLSYLPWHSTFFRILNHCAEMTNSVVKAKYVFKFLESIYSTEVPQPGTQLSVTYCTDDKVYEFNAVCPDHHKLPSIPQDRNLTEYFNAIDAMNMIVIFANMLNERRIIMTSKKLSRLSACVQAANSLIYPMHWQHIFIPVLPNHLLDYLSAPMPFLIGVPSVIMNRVKRSELGDIVVLDCDENRIDSPFDDVQMLPTDIVHTLKKSLRNPMPMLGDLVARAFLRALVALIGGYRDALRFTPGQKISFNYNAFVCSRSPSVQTFLEKMLELQIFRQFIEGRLEMLNNGEGFSDEFEFELNMYEDKTTHRLKTQYKEWLGAMRKEGGAILKTVNPAMRSAFKSVKDKGKQAFKQVKTKMQNNDKTYNYSNNTQIPSTDYKAHKPSSAPSSPTLPPKVNSIKKSISGNVIGKTDKTVTYVRQRSTKNDSNDKRGTVLQNGFKKSFSVTNGLSIVPSGQSGSNRLAPEASPEVSDVDSENSHEMLTFDRIEIDLMGELKDFLHKKSSGDESSNSYKSINSQNSLSSNSTQSNANNLIAKPIPPPRSINRKTGPGFMESSGTQEMALIELDSPPDDITKEDTNSVIFDPLFEPKPIESQKSSSNTLNSMKTDINSLRINLTPFKPISSTNGLSPVAPNPVNPFLSFDNQINNGFGGQQSVAPLMAQSSSSSAINSALTLTTSNRQTTNTLNDMINWSSSQITPKPNLLPKPLTVPSMPAQYKALVSNSSTSNPFKTSNSWQHFD